MIRFYAGLLIFSFSIINLFLAAAFLFIVNDARDAGLFYLLLAIGSALPGAILFFPGQRARARKLLQSRILDYLAARDEVDPAVAAAYFSVSGDKFELTLLEIIRRKKVDFVHHQKRGSYIRRSTLQTAARVVDKCPSCGAVSVPVLILPGETVDCRYCGSALNSSLQGEALRPQ